MLSTDIETERGISGMYPVQMQRLAKEYKTRGVGKTLLLHEKPIACGGIMHAWPGLGFAWAVLSPLARRRPHVKITHDAVFASLTEYIKSQNLRRLEANIDSQLYVGQRWVERLGFVKESEMPCFGPQGQDFFKYVIVRRP